MFRKLYKEANDNIIIDEALLEKTLKTAFSAEAKRPRKINFTAVSSLAAAIAVVIGCGVAYPALINKPVTEPIPVADSEICAVIPTNQTEETPSTTMPVQNKQITASKKTKKANQPILRSMPDAEKVQSVADTESVAVASADIAPRMMPENSQVVAGGGMEMPEEFSQVSSVYNEDGTEIHVYAADDKIMTVSVIPVTSEEKAEVAEAPEAENVVNVVFSKDDVMYDIKAENMTEEEVKVIFEEYITQ